MTVEVAVQEALEAALKTFDGVPAGFVPELEKPRAARFGDLSSNCALKLARHLRRPPLAIAQALVAELVLDPLLVDSCEVVRPGFINFRFARGHLYQALADCLDAGPCYGRSTEGRDRTVLVEFVSANPTGPLTVGHGRNAVLGDTIANMLEWTGYTVAREYYYNDAGRQMRVLGASVRARYEQMLFQKGLLPPGMQYATKLLDRGSGEEPRLVPASFPDDGYLGAYIAEVALRLVDKWGARLLRTPDLRPFIDEAETLIFASIRRTLKRLGIRMDTFFNERSLYDNGALEEVLGLLEESGYLYRKEGATWLRTSALDKDQDTVLVKSSGEPTYRLPDIAYHRDKVARGYDACIDIFGADHIATYPDILRALRVLNVDADRIEVIIYQFVTLTRAGQEIKMSTRRATFVTLDALIQEVGPDVTRFFFVMRSAGRHLEFDLDLAKEASDKNPVFYLQYAHARICSIVAKARGVGLVTGSRPSSLALLSHPAELALIRSLVRFPKVLLKAAQAREPHRLTVYLRSVAEAFSRFYHECRIIKEPSPIAGARMALAIATRTVLANGLSVLGISAPERMDRRDETP